MRRTPPGVRGLKWLVANRHAPKSGSHPTRGAWIEILLSIELGGVSLSRTPPGVRGLKSLLPFSVRIW